MKISDEMSRRTAEERVRQLAKWDEQNHPDGTSLDNQEIADAAREACDTRFTDGIGTWLDILLEEVFEASAEVDEERLITELIQVAAVAESWADAIRRRQSNRQALQETIHQDLVELTSDDLAALRARKAHASGNVEATS